MHTHTHSLCLRAPQNSISMCALTYYCESYGACLCVFVSIVNYLIVHNWIERTKKNQRQNKQKQELFIFALFEATTNGNYICYTHTHCVSAVLTPSFCEWTRPANIFYLVFSIHLIRESFLLFFSSTSSDYCWWCDASITDACVCVWNIFEQKKLN